MRGVLSLDKVLAVTSWIEGFLSGVALMSSHLIRPVKASETDGRIFQLTRPGAISKKKFLDGGLALICTVTFTVIWQREATGNVKRMMAPCLMFILG